jgi:hypothetical protein
LEIQLLLEVNVAEEKIDIGKVIMPEKIDMGKIIISEKIDMMWIW